MIKYIKHSVCKSEKGGKTNNDYHVNEMKKSLRKCEKLWK